MTAWSDIIAAAMILIDDVRWRDDLATSPAIFYRAKSDWVKLALPKLNRPPEFYEYLVRDLSEPEFAENSWTSDTDSLTAETVVETGNAGFDICSVALRSADGKQLTAYTDFEYDPETGDVTMGIQPQTGLNYTIDFYTDGSVNDLTPAQMNLFALAISSVWDERQDRNWLNMQMKIHDSAFQTASEGTYTEKINQRLMRNVQLFRDALSKYEQDCAYYGRFQNGNSSITLI